ncbi:hypothetical protein [Streptomyces sp. NPDC050504]|uniref:Rv1733c family protein n=1 Tax=Streptomyces sp. NPDC050504 TaxID=3365618 RepID=UPI0037A9F232
MRTARQLTWRWRRNPLRRTGDLVEAWTVLALGVVLVLGAPAAAFAAGRAAYESVSAEARAQHSERHRVRAVLAQDVPVRALGSRKAAVRWTDPSGQRRQATVTVSGDSRGDTVDVWLDRKGQAVEAPLDDGDVWLYAFAAGCGGAVGAALLAVCARLCVGHVIMRHRMAAWERAWQRTGPEWGRRRA